MQIHKVVPGTAEQGGWLGFSPTNNISVINIRVFFCATEILIYRSKLVQATVCIKVGYFYLVQLYMIALKLSKEKFNIGTISRWLLNLEEFLAISEALNFKIFPGHNSRFEAFHSELSPAIQNTLRGP